MSVIPPEGETLEYSFNSFPKLSKREKVFAYFAQQAYRDFDERIHLIDRAVKVGLAKKDKATDGVYVPLDVVTPWPRSSSFLGVYTSSEASRRPKLLIRSPEGRKLVHDVYDPVHAADFPDEKTDLGLVVMRRRCLGLASPFQDPTILDQMAIRKGRVNNLVELMGDIQKSKFVDIDLDELQFDSIPEVEAQAT